MPSVDDVLAQCESRKDRPYWSADGRRLDDDADPGNDCSGLMVVVLRAAGIDVPATVSSSQAAWCFNNGGEISVNKGLQTPGALLFMGPNRGLSGFGDAGHVALVVGENEVFETPCAAGHFSGFSSNAQNRGWSGAGLIPGVGYVNAPRPIQPHVESGTYLRLGSTGEQVVELQVRLSRVGYGLEIDGEFGPITDTCVRAFQSSYNLEVDGIVGPITWQALADAVPNIDDGADMGSAPASDGFPQFSGRMLGFGDTGDDVAIWQRRMRERGWDIDVDGIYGAQTKRVVLAFQREKGLEVDGWIGPITWDAAWTAPIT